MTMVTVFGVVAVVEAGAGVAAEAGVAVLDGDEQPAAVSSNTTSTPPIVSDVVIYFPPRFSNAAIHSLASFSASAS